jgi:pSer/pThr/pTyr-binding forkhead associated (FHA) protein
MVNHTGDVLTIEDLGSSNGTLVNNNKIAGKVILNMNDAVRIGVYTLRVEIKKAFDMEGAKAPSDWEGRTMMAPRK